MSKLIVPVDDATDATLDEIAAATQRAKSDVAAELLADYARHSSEFEALVREAREDFAAGKAFSHDEVVAGARAIIDAAKARGA